MHKSLILFVIDNQSNIDNLAFVNDFENRETGEALIISHRWLGYSLISVTMIKMSWNYGRVRQRASQTGEGDL